MKNEGTMPEELRNPLLLSIEGWQHYKLVIEVRNGQRETISG
jgi:hypothetical protein